jgi:hypothetical protein
MHVVPQVVESIEDDIREEELITYLEKVYYNLPVSKKCDLGTKPVCERCDLHDL